MLIAKELNVHQIRTARNMFRDGDSMNSIAIHFDTSAHLVKKALFKDDAMYLKKGEEPIQLKTREWNDFLYSKWV